MIVDLLRNDLGRVCEYGSVRVPAVCRLETYEHVHHLVSEVRGRLRPEMGPVDLLRAAFPGGSVTGAPKVRAMEIIAELEPVARGPYCGSLGYVGFDGSMDTSILIRTFTAGRGWYQFPVGGGVVADSTPEGEYAETLRQSQGLDFALRIGINTGPVVVGRIGDDLRMDYTAQGETVNLAARLQAANAGPHPIYLRVEPKAGHGAGTPIGKTIHELVDSLSFTFHELGVRI